MNTQLRRSMRLPRFYTPAAIIVATLLTACGGGGSSTSPAPEAVKTLASVAAKDIPAQWPDNFKTVNLKRIDLVTDAELAQTTNKPNAIFIQIWYLDQDRQRQSVAVLSLDALTRLGGSITIKNVLNRPGFRGGPLG